MARFHGEVGYGVTTEVSAGVWEDTVVEKTYTGDIIRNTKRTLEGLGANDDFVIGHSVSVVADAFASEHYSAIRYVKLAGSRWKVTEVEILRPRLLLRLGGVYNGPTP